MTVGLLPLCSVLLIQVYCSLVRPILEFASPVWAALPTCLVQLVEGPQKSALRIILPDCSYESALVSCGLPIRCWRAVMRLAGVSYLTSRSPVSFLTCCHSPRMSFVGMGWGRVFPVLIIYYGIVIERTALVILLLTVTIGINCFCRCAKCIKCFL